MIVLNFAHPLTLKQQEDIASLCGQAIERIIELQAQFEHDQPFASQARALVDAVGLSSTQWQQASLLVNLPSFSLIAALVLAELHGRCGYFPAVLRLRPLLGTTPPQFGVAEVLNLQLVRDQARQGR